MNSHNEYINTYLEMLKPAQKKQQTNNINILLEEKRKLAKRKLIVEEARNKDDKYTIIYAKKIEQAEETQLFNHLINVEYPDKYNTDDDKKKLKLELSNKIKNSNEKILTAFGLQNQEKTKDVPIAVQSLFNKNQIIKSLEKEHNFIIINNDNNKVIYKSKDDPNYYIINTNMDIIDKHNTSVILSTLYETEHINILQNKKNIQKASPEILNKFKEEICKNQYTQIFVKQNKQFEKYYDNSFNKKLDLFNWFTDNFIFNHDVKIYFINQKGQIELDKDILKNDDSITKYAEKIKSIMTNDKIIYHIESIRDLLNAIVLKDMDLNKNITEYQSYKKFNDDIRKSIVDWIENSIQKHKSCSLQSCVKGYQKIDQPVFKKQQLDYDKKAKQVLNGFSKYKKKHKDQFEGLKQANINLYNDILYVLGQNDSPNNKQLKPYMTILKQGTNISLKAYRQLQELKKQFINWLKIEKFQQFAKDVTEDQVNAAAAKIPKGQEDKFIKKLSKEQKQQCKSLGFRTKKQAAGFAALFENLLENIFSFFGAGREKKKSATDSQIRQNMKYVSRLIKDKKIQPGEYPIYFDIKDIDKEFEPYIKNSTAAKKSDKKQEK